MTKARPHPSSLAVATSAEGSRRWLLLVHQLPATPSNLRVRTWRRLQQLGAVPLRQAVYVLPDSASAREDFEWLKAEIAAAGGEASILTGTHIEASADAELVEAFKRARQNDYTNLARDLEAALKKTEGGRRPRGGRPPAVRRLSESFRQRLSSVETVDFFASAGRDRVIALIERLHAAGGAASTRPAADAGDATRYRDRLWVTRPLPGVDRMASAWLVRRFIDTKARFAFAADRAAVPGDALPFDMFGVEFTHQGDDCTFETLCRRFGIEDPAVARIGELVHDLDLKDGKFAAPEAATIGAMIDGLQLTYADDHDLLEQGMAMFESLYRSFERSARRARPRGVARAKPAAKRR
jgi:hypothetical protein